MIRATVVTSVPSSRAFSISCLKRTAAYFCLVIAVGRRWCTRDGWGQRQTLAVITGALLPTIAVSLLLPAALRELEPLATVPMLGVLVWLSRTARRRAQLTAPR